MKVNKIKKGILRTVSTALLVCTLFLCALWNLSTPTSAASAADPSLFEEVSGNFHLGMAPGIKDPQKITVAEEYYYKPSAYVYFGAAYNSATGEYEPILCRVLDADADNAGDGEAMFVLTENAVRANDRFKFWDYNDYIDYENIYNVSFIATYRQVESLFKAHYPHGKVSAEIDYIRPITKTDVLANMSGAFGYTESLNWEINVYDEDANATLSVEEAELLIDARLFPLSVEELLQYVGNYNGIQGMATTHITTKASVTWWLRTGLDDDYGNLMGAVDESGKVVPVSVDSDSVAGRYAFNIETADISYTQHLGNNVYRLAYTLPQYKDGESPFNAEVIDVKDGKVTIGYSNYIPAYNYGDDETEYISVIIKDKDTNEIKYYGTVATVPSGNDPNVIVSDERTASFILPKDYNDGDTVSVFWERKQSNAESISYTSNMVDLDCIHTADTAATCISLALCDKCGLEYGSADKENHTNVGAEFYYDDETDTHWNVCGDCGENTNIESCVFGYICTATCKCGNIDITYNMHSFDDNGVCTRDKSHFELPHRIDKGAISHFDINNEGQLISFAKYVADGRIYNEYGEYWGYPSIVSLKSDLDFTDIDGFVPIGTDENPFDALTFHGEGHTVSGIGYDSDGSHVGLFGVVENTDIENIKLTSSSFSGASGVGALIGKATNVKVSYVTVDGVTLAANDGSVGSVMAISDENSEIGYSISYDVKNRDGLNVPFTSDGNAVIDKSYCLAEAHNAERGEMTFEQFESGEVGYLFGQNYSSVGQNIGVDRYPYVGGAKVYMTETCGGDTVYFNDVSLRAQIEAHEYTAFEEEDPTFIWEPKMGTETYNCYVSAVCGVCSHVGLMEAEVVMDYSRIPVRGDWTASITLGGVTKTESKTEIGRLIQDMIGMTGIVKDFDASVVWPEDLMTNHRLVTSPSALKEYEVFFVNPETGEKYCYTYTDSQMGMWVTVTEPIGVMAAGTYDLLVIGKNDYEGQEYTYKGALVINSVTVTVSPLDVYKYYDGNTGFESNYTLDNENVYGDWFEIVLGNSNSADPGEYTVDVSIKYNSRANDYQSYKNSVTLVIAKDKVSAVILPALYQSIENKNYPTTFTYGETVPIPTKDNFTVNGGGELSFEWYRAEYDHYGSEPLSLTKVDGVPSDAGDYILRVRAAATEGLLSAYADFEITIDRKWLWVEPSVPEDTETVSLRYTEYYSAQFYVVDSLDKVTAVIFDENDALFEVDGIKMYCHFEYQGDSNDNTARCYYVEYYAVLEDSGVSSYNYKIVSGGINLAFLIDNDSPVREITMLVKECSVDLSSPYVEFDIRNVVMNAGEVFLLGHTLTDVKLVIDREYGEILVAEFIVIDANGNDVSSLYRPITKIDGWSHLNGGNNVVHIFDNPCDTDCNVEGCTIVRSAHHTGGAATCITPAICCECGELYGDVNEYNHTRSETVIAPNPENLLTHLVLHSCCGRVVGEAEHTEGSPATCTERAICSVCGWSYGELDPTNHSSLERSYAPDPENANNHLKTYLCCGAVDHGSHSGGEATCVALASCELCKTPYGELDPENHTELPTAIPVENDASLHHVSYACCGFAMDETHSGGEATCIVAKMCEKCNAEYGDVDPENHASDNITYLIREDNASMHDLYHSCCHEYIDKEYHSGGVATCASAASCEYCGTPYGNTDPSNHAIDEYSYAQSLSDETKHTKAHACCGKEISDEAHSGGEANCLHGTLCEYCGTDYGEKTDHVYDNGCDSICNVCGELTRSLSFHCDDDGNYHCDVCGNELPKESLSGGAISAIATSSTVVTGLGGFSLFWFAIKKKSWLALLKLLLG